MSTARHHTEWLSLVEASGPFLSLPVLLKTFPAGLDAHDPEHLRLLRLAQEEWLDSQFGARPDAAIHRAWVEFVLKQTLELPDEVLLLGQSIPTGLCANIAEHGETLRPDWVIVNPSGTPGAGKPRLLIQVVSADQNLEKHLKGSSWQASPATRGRYSEDTVGEILLNNFGNVILHENSGYFRSDRIIKSCTLK